VLLALAAAEPKVLEQPEPYVFCEAYGDSSIDLELSVWIDDQSLHRKIKSELNYAIDLAFKAHNIEIPFPQREVHIKSAVQGPALGPLV
jgi:small-conductance mechanosensitive channel